MAVGNWCTILNEKLACKYIAATRGAAHLDPIGFSQPAKTLENSTDGIAC